MCAHMHRGRNQCVCMRVCARVCVYGEDAACLCVGEQFAHRAQELKGLCWLLT